MPIFTIRFGDGPYVFLNAKAAASDPESEIYAAGLFTELVDVPEAELSNALETGVVDYVFSTSWDITRTITQGLAPNAGFLKEPNGAMPTDVGDFIIASDEGTETRLLNGSDFFDGKRGADIAFGNAGADYLEGRQGADQLFGGRDADTLLGGLGDDLLDGGAENDRLSGEVGNDTMFGGTGDDDLRGGRGRDIMSGGDGDDFLRGGPGADILGGGRDDDNVQGGQGYDILRGATGDDTLGGGAGNDTLIGGRGADVFEFLTEGTLNQDVVEDFDVTADFVILDTNSFQLTQQGDDAVLTLNDTETLTFEDIIDFEALSLRIISPFIVASDGG